MKRAKLPKYKYTGIHFGLHKDFRLYKIYLVDNQEVSIPLESKLTILDYLKEEETDR